MQDYEIEERKNTIIQKKKAKKYIDMLLNYEKYNDIFEDIENHPEIKDFFERIGEFAEFKQYLNHENLIYINLFVPIKFLSIGTEEDEFMI